MTALPGPDVERVLERAHDDPRFEAALRDAYCGRHDVLDALWWAAHPLTESPRGVLDPAAGLTGLQRAAYARVSDPTDARESQQRLQEAQLLLAEDARNLTDAVGAIEQEAARLPVSSPKSEEEADSGPKTRRKVLLPALAGGLLLAAIMVLPALSQLNTDADRSPTSSARPPDRVHTEIVTLGSEGNVTDPLAILERPQAPGDQPRGELRFSAETYRALPSLVPHVELYLARGNFPEAICLVVVGQDERSMSTCQPASGFTNDELQLGRGRYELSSDMTILTESYSLFPNGDFRYTATARVTGELAFPGTGSVVAPEPE